MNNYLSRQNNGSTRESEWTGQLGGSYICIFTNGPDSVDGQVFVVDRQCVCGGGGHIFKTVKQRNKVH